ncbi:TPA: hypothetical protein ACMDOZ_002171 [Vibrio cholerae]|uniref:hypothetical protein n=1 Tax=Vibrio cholerae TaxID=666 RepID=UPI000E67EDBE|nr:hypothetical protein [Vibrio cholerae]
MAKFKLFIISALLTVVSVNALADTYVCESPSSLHQKKIDKYKMPEFPKLLRDCGLEDLLGSFGLENIFKLPDVGILCGYSSKDIAEWYGLDSSVNVGGKINVDLNVVDEASKMFGNEPLFEISK